jgi:hypothetical protein
MTAPFASTRRLIHKGVTFVDETSPGEGIGIVGFPGKPRSQNRVIVIAVEQHPAFVIRINA